MVLFIQDYIENSDNFIKKCLVEYIKINKSLILDYDFDNISNNFLDDILINREGKPYITYKGKPFVHFNLSHSGSIMVAVLSNQNVGVDIEKQVPRDYLNIAKREHFATPKNLVDFYNMWTKYEAIAKFTGRGILDIVNIKDISVAKNINIISGYSIAVTPFNDLIISILT